MIDNTKVTIGISIRPHVRERLNSVCTMLGTTQAKLVEAIVSTMSTEELKELFDRQEGLDRLEAVLQRKASQDVLQIVRGKSADMIRQMAIAAERSIEQQSES